MSISSSGALTSRSLVLPVVSVGNSGSTTVSGKGSPGDPAPAITGLHGANPVLMESMSKHKQRCVLRLRLWQFKDCQL